MPPQIATDRLILRPFTPEDTDAAHAVLDGHPDVWRYDPGYQMDRAERAEMVRKCTLTNSANGCGTLAVVLPEADVLIGYVGLQLYVLPREPLATPEVELYYKIGRDHWGQGYATEACRALVRFAFGTMRLQRIVTTLSEKNERSVRMVQRLGMRIAEGPPAWGGLIGTLENDRVDADAH